MENSNLTHHLNKVISELKHSIADEIVSQLTKSITSLETSKENERLLTADELCTVLNISTSHFYKMKKKYKNLPVINFDGVIRYRQSDFEDFFKNQVK